MQPFGKIDMLKHSKQNQEKNRPRWYVLAATGFALLLLSQWIARQRQKTSEKPVGTHARLIPMDRLQTEARWSRQAAVHSSTSKG